MEFEIIDGSVHEARVEIIEGSVHEARVTDRLTCHKTRTLVDVCLYVCMCLRVGVRACVFYLFIQHLFILNINSVFVIQFPDLTQVLPNLVSLGALLNFFSFIP